jgi:hypothetical protein
MSFDPPGEQTSGLGNLAGPTSSLGNLAQSARKKHINEARGSLIVVGVLMILINGFVVATLRSTIHSNLQAALAKQPGMMIDQATLQEVEDTLVRSGSVECFLFIGAGIAIFVLGLLTTKYPVPCTLLGLIIYVAITAIFLINLLNSGGPELVGVQIKGMIWRIIMIVALIKAVQAAIAYQREEKEALPASEQFA